jgi:hypothetical protein
LTERVASNAAIAILNASGMNDRVLPLISLPASNP